MVRLIYDFDNTIAKTSWHAVKKIWPSFVQKDWPEKERWLKENESHFLAEMPFVGYFGDPNTNKNLARQKALHGLHRDMLPFFEKELCWNFQPIAQTKEEAGIILKLFYTPVFYDDLKVGEGTDTEYDALMKTMEIAREKGWKLCFCTNRRSDAFKLAEDWLLAHGIIFDEMIKVNTFDKGHIFADNDEVQNIFIDDKPECMLGHHKGKILFGEYKYQADNEIDETYLKAKNWVEVVRTLENFN